VAVNVIVPFTGIGFAGALSMLTLATGTTTFTVHVVDMLLPSVVVAVMVAVPADTGVTKPVAGSTFATELLSLLQLTALFEALVGVMVAVKSAGVSLTFIVKVLGFTVILATGTTTFTVQVADKLLPSVVVAFIIAVPADTAVTKPVAESTVATLGLLLVQFKVWLSALIGFIEAYIDNVPPT
jgi:ethanolamine utilization microcompartment shell protein EutS